MRKTFECYINIFEYYILDAIFSQLTYVAWLCGIFAWTKNSSNLTSFDIVIGYRTFLSEAPSHRRDFMESPLSSCASLSCLLTYSSSTTMVINAWNKITKNWRKWHVCLIFYLGWHSLKIRVECRGGSKEGAYFTHPLPSRDQIFLNLNEFFFQKIFLKSMEGLSALAQEKSYIRF